MTTTTLRLPDELKARIAAAAQRTGTTPHGFMLDAIAEKTAEAERKAEFDALADARFASVLQSGETIPWEQMREYLLQRAAGAPAERPRTKKTAP